MTGRTVQRNLWASGLVALILLLYWTDSTGGYFAALDEAETSKNCFCEVRDEIILNLGLITPLLGRAESLVIFL